MEQNKQSDAFRICQEVVTMLQTQDTVTLARLWVLHHSMRPKPNEQMEAIWQS